MTLARRSKSLVGIALFMVLAIAMWASSGDSFASSCIVEMTPPNLYTYSYSSVLDDMRAGDRLVIATIARNCGEMDQPFVVIMEARNSEGVTESLGLQSGTLKGNGQTQVGVSWVPAHGGTYEMRAFAISSRDSPMILSQITVSEVTIAPFAASIPLVIGNTTYHGRYELLSGNIDIFYVEVDPEVASIHVAVDDVEHNTALRIYIPLEVIEEFRKATNDRFVDDDFVVFVDEIAVDAEWEMMSHGRIVTFELEEGSQDIEIVGNLLM